MSAERRKWCLLTACDEGFADISSISVPTMERYAETYGMDFDWVQKTPKDRSPHWQKIYSAQEKFEAGYEFVFWVDADAMFLRYDIDIRSQIDDRHDFYFAREEHIRREWGVERLNSGVWVMRNTPLTRKFLAEVALQPDMQGPNWHDQAAIMVVFGFLSMIDDGLNRADRPVSEYTTRLRMLPLRWNCIAGNDTDPRTVIRHFAGHDRITKRLGMELEVQLQRLRDEYQLTDETAEDLRFRIYKGYWNHKHGWDPEGSLKELTERQTRLDTVHRALKNEHDELLRKVGSRSWLLRTWWRTTRSKLYGASHGDGSANRH
ncbi:Nucleotide-diphospho-sugar transferase [Faunimonas pinastri]|uniref:Nucleotide-diphospho-sugar transferase n=1 Tax=Faunimonas pinastri TaxID=1855383 RepID=A0A1H9PLT0_9HYPH|nr:putative nucleotide-diphospho-sugar transferase [Faunimonas pinastri]SER49154.1 Nucleotide-diphospho-sugar transferase [Faunimonas pinastri]